MNGTKIQLLGITVVLAGIATNANNAIAWICAGIGLVVSTIGCLKGDKETPGK